jgi:hypothetical protein
MIYWKPNGSLDIASAPTDLPIESGNGSQSSVAMSRCKNLVLENNGKAKTRHGSSRPTGTSLNKIANFMIEQSGNRYTFTGENIYRDETLIASALNDAQWSAIKYNAFNDTTQRIFALNGTDRKKINGTTVNEWGITAPDAAPTLGVGAGTGLTGTYNIRYTYAVKSGTTVITESNPSPAASSGQALSNEDLDVAWTASTDNQVTHVRLYRTLAGGSIYYHDQDIAIGSVTIDTSTVDVDLGAEVAIDHDRPPLGSIVSGPVYNGLCFIAKDNLLYWCKAKQPEYWPALNFIEVGSPQFPIKCIINYDSQVYVLTENQIWWIQGTTGSAFNPVPLESLAGASNIFGAEAIKGVGIYHIGDDGIYLYSSGRDKKVTQNNFEPIFPDAGGSDGQPTNGVLPVPDSPTTYWLRKFQNKVYFHYGNGSVIVTDIDNNRAWYYKYDRKLAAPCLDKTNKKFFTCDSDKVVRQIEDPEVTTDAGTAISWEIETPEFTLQTRKHFPRFVKYDVDVDNASSVTGKVLLDGSIVHTHNITDSRNTNRRLIDTDNGNRMSVRLNGTGQTVIYAIEAE